VVVATCFVVAAFVEAVFLHRDAPGLLLFTAAGAPLLAVIAVRRTRPVVPVAAIAAFAVFGTAVQAAVWPQAGDGGGVWLFALLFACYSLGAHGRGRVVGLGGLLPLLVALAIDLPSMTGWDLVSGVAFVTLFVGVLPTAVGRLVRVRRDRLATLAEQHDLIAREQRDQREAAVLAERLRTTEQIQPVLLDGLRALASQAEAEAADPGEIEQAARALLGRTRDHVLVLTAPVDLPVPQAPAPADWLAPLRAGAQRWAVLGAGAIAAGLALESTTELPLSAPAWLAVVLGGLVCLPLSLVWWRPLPAVTVAWCLAIAFSRLVAPLDGSLSGAGFTLACAFGVAALSRRRTAVVGLAVCWLGGVAGVGSSDPFGVGMIIAVCWVGGVVVNEVSAVVEQTRANNRLLAGQEQVARQRAVVEERLRLAREVHDQIGHSLTVVALQAGAARRMAATDPARTREVLTTVAGAARGGLAAMAGRDTDDLASLLQRTRAAGLNIRAEVEGLEAPGLVDPATRTLAVRIVQEALTNVLRHAPGAPAHVAVRHRGDGLMVEVGNGAPAGSPTTSGSGLGLAGLADRVTAHGGELAWGPRGDGGFVLRAVLPIRRLQKAAP
jgi:signal transduction histidine kinase